MLDQSDKQKEGGGGGGFQTPTLKQVRLLAFYVTPFSNEGERGNTYSWILKIRRESSSSLSGLLDWPRRKEEEKGGERRGVVVL